ncbi:beta-ketoacyl synthase N-terminal-like domain-containing protein [Desulfocicer vacuolatum]|nr:beta-ketoacyl synthase N-terminal-like domain-containing protein [Desulfocicer vacuolatum]
MTLHREKIAVVGISGIFPGAPDVDTFSRNIMAKKEAVIDVPPGRWDIPPEQAHSTVYRPDTVASKRAGLITDFIFDPHGFTLSPDLLSALDPLHHLVLSAGQRALSHCHCPEQIKAKTGVILAAIALPTQCTSDIARQVIMEHRGDALTRAQALAAGVVSVPAALLARAMGLHGGCFTLDAACASSLFAIKLACDQLALGRTDMMIAGGVSRPDSLYTQVGFTQLKALSPSGRCAPFDQQADGLVVGEGTGMVVLKRMTDALACQDTIHGVITGTGWSNDIGGNLVAPSSDGQIRAMAAAYQQAGWSPKDVQHIECHGSATPVGDGVELNSMKTLWENAGITGDNNLTCAIGSVKSMVGHLLTAAGAAGFIKTLMAMKTKQLPPSLNFTAPPKNSPLYQTPFRVQTDPEPWIPCSLSRDKSIAMARRAGVSAFGFGGINAHILVEEYRKEIPAFYYTANALFAHTDKKNRLQDRSRSLAASAPHGNGGDVPPWQHNIDADHSMDSSPDKKNQNAQSHGVAIVGMALITPGAEDIDALAQLMISPGQKKTTPIPESLCHGTIGQWMDEIHTFAGEFHIPPNQIPDLLSQHLMMLKAAMTAMKDAGISLRPNKKQALRNRFGAAIGIEFDHGATDFHLGWLQRHGKAQPNASHGALPLPSLTANKTLGALGGIVASRIAREFQLGGPCFTLSADANSGLKALEVGINAIEANETDIFLCGAVDMAGDLRQTLLARCLATQDHCRNTDLKNSPPKEPSWSEGAVAVVLKSLEKAMADKDNIYSVITATGGTCGGEMAAEGPSLSSPVLEKAYETSLKTTLDRGNLSFSNIEFHMIQGCGACRSMEMDILKKLHQSPKKRTQVPSMGASCDTLGHTFGISGLVSTVQASLALYHGLTPGMETDIISMGHGTSRENGVPRSPVTPPPWISHVPTNKAVHACVASVTRDGACGHVILKSPPMGITALADTAKKAGEKNTTPAISPENKIILKAHGFPSDKFIPLPLPHERIKAPQNRDKQLHSGTTLPQRDSRSQGAIQSFSRNSSDAVASGNFSGNGLAQSITATEKAHMKFLELSQENTKALETQFNTLTHLASTLVKTNPMARGGFMDVTCEDNVFSPFPDKDNSSGRKNADHSVEISREKRTEQIHAPTDIPPAKRKEPLFDRHHCLTFAVGNAGAVLGKKFNIIDTYPVRVRLPDEPLMLVDRIMAIEGEMLSMGPGKIITQHDVHPDAWYLDGGKAPVSISIEAGQADLFLCSFLGIDHKVKGHRRYRLLDARVTFHRPLPQPGETIEYHIVIDRFLKQGDVYLFFFHYKGYIDNTLFISMRDGCAGFFTPLEVENSGGIILKKEEIAKDTRICDFQIPVPVQKEQYTKTQVEALRQGDLAACFGSIFEGVVLGKKLRLPGGRMHLIDRVVSFDPAGGRFGLGLIIAEADIHPDDWFLTCHFVDDKVMPGTLMYECCAHALRIFTQRVGWISQGDDVHYDIIPGMESDLKCRGPVTPETRKARYEIEIKTMGYDPEPFVVADAHMFSDDHRIVLYKNMGMKLVGLSRREIENFWSNR